MRRTAALVAAAGLLIALAGCASDPATASCTSPYPSGAASDTVTASGTFGGSTTTASFPTPLVAPKPQVSVLTQGSGDVVHEGDYVQLVLTTFDAKTGQAGTPQTGIAEASSTNALGELLECQSVGSRVAAVGALEGQATTVFVMDVQKVIQGKADGTPTLPQAGIPEVVTAPDGTPGITVSNLAIPTVITSATTKAGHGATVKTGNEVLVKYTVFSWEKVADANGTLTGKATVASTSWGSGGTGPAQYSVAPYQAQASGSTSLATLPPGTEKALTGQKVGSQVIVIVPPKDSYASGQATDSVAEGATRVYVFDILETQAQ